MRVGSLEWVCAEPVLEVLGSLIVDHLQDAVTLQLFELIPQDVFMPSPLLDVEVETIVLLRTDSSNQNRVLPCWDVESDSLLGLVYLETFYRLKSSHKSLHVSDALGYLLAVKQGLDRQLVSVVEVQSDLDVLFQTVLG